MVLATWMIVWLITGTGEIGHFPCTFKNKHTAAQFVNYLMTKNNYNGKIQYYTEACPEEMTHRKLKMRYQWKNPLKPIATLEIPIGGEKNGQ